MTIVLVEFFNGDTTEAMAFKTLDSMVEYFEYDLYSDSDGYEPYSDAVESLKRQIEAHKKSGYDIMDIDLMNIVGHTMQVWSQYPLG